MSARRTWPQYFRTCLRYRWVLLLPATLFFGAAVLFTVVKADVYEGSATLLPPRAQPANDIIGDVVRATLQDMLRAAQERIHSHDLLLRVVNELELYPEIAHAGRDRAAVAKARNHLSVRMDGRARAIAIVFRHSGGDRPAQTAADVANRLAGLFIEDQERAVRAKARQVKAFLEREEERIDAALTKAETNLKDFRKTNMGKLPEDYDNSVTLVSHAENRIQLYLERQKSIQSELDRYMVSSFELERKIAQPDVQDGGGDWLAQTFRRHIADLEAQLVADQRRYREDSEHLVELRAQIKEAKVRLEEMLSRSPGNSMSDFYRLLLDQQRARRQSLIEDLQLAEEKIEQANLQITRIQANLEATSSLEVEYKALQRTVDDARGRRASLLNRLQEVEFVVAFQEGSEQMPLSLEQPAIAATAPVGPKHLLVSLFGLGLGLALGAAALYARMFVNPTCEDGEELRRLLPGTVVVILPDVEGTRTRTTRVLMNVFLSLFVVACFFAGLALLGIRVGWIGDPRLLEPLVDTVERLKSAI